MCTYDINRVNNSSWFVIQLVSQIIPHIRKLFNTNEVSSKGKPTNNGYANETRQYSK